jgi:excisionase family DNA binding protein
MTERLFTARQVAEQLGVCTETVLVWIRAGKLPAIRLAGRAIRVRETALEAKLEEWATPERGVVTQPAGRRPAAIVIGVTQPEDEE